MTSKGLWLSTVHASSIGRGLTKGCSWDHVKVSLWSTIMVETVGSSAARVNDDCGAFDGAMDLRGHVLDAKEKPWLVDWSIQSFPWWTIYSRDSLTVKLSHRDCMRLP